MSALVAGDVAAVQEAIREGGPLIPVAGGTQTATHPITGGAADPADASHSTGAADPADAVRALDVSGLAGVVDYDPAELTFTARPGTPLAEIEAMLASHGQHLPFDPPRLGEGATLGGAVAAGVTGPNGFAAGVRDFVVGVRFVDGTGRLATGGGKVVKNAAGFDLPKLMVGSLGRLGVMTELSLKVFPRPAATATVRFPTAGLPAGLDAIAALARGPVPVTALDLDPDGAATARIGGDAALIDARAARLARSIEPGGEPIPDPGRARRSVDPYDGVVSADEAYWEEARRFAWVAAGNRLVVVPLAPRRVLALDPELDRRGLIRRYGLAANVAWIGWPEAEPVADLSDLLAAHALSGVVLTGPPLPEPLIGVATGGPFARRIAAALDPAGVFAGGGR